MQTKTYTPTESLHAFQQATAYAALLISDEKYSSLIDLGSGILPYSIYKLKNGKYLANYHQESSVEYETLNDLLTDHMLTIKDFSDFLNYL